MAEREVAGPRRTRDRRACGGALDACRDVAPRPAPATQGSRTLGGCDGGSRASLRRGGGRRQRAGTRTRRDPCRTGLSAGPRTMRCHRLPGPRAGSEPAVVRRRRLFLIAEGATTRRRGHVQPLALLRRPDRVGRHRAPLASRLVVRARCGLRQRGRCLSPLGWRAKDEHPEGCCTHAPGGHRVACRANRWCAVWLVAASIHVVRRCMCLPAGRERTRGTPRVPARDGAAVEAP